jgi:hypothetical protein
MRDLADQLRQAAAAMPPAERRRFLRYLASLEGKRVRDLVPGTPVLPAITINAPVRRPRARSQRRSAGREPAQMPLI